VSEPSRWQVEVEGDSLTFFDKTSPGGGGDLGFARNPDGSIVIDGGTHFRWKLTDEDRRTLIEFLTPGYEIIPTRIAALGRAVEAITPSTSTELVLAIIYERAGVERPQ
jgi:hypothetical protein